MWTLTLSRVRTVYGRENGRNVSPEEHFWLLRVRSLTCLGIWSKEIRTLTVWMDSEQMLTFVSPGSTA